MSATLSRTDLMVLAHLQNEKARDFAFSKSPVEAGWRHRDGIAARYFHGAKDRTDKILARLVKSGDVETRQHWVSFPQPQPDNARGVDVTQFRAVRAQAYSD